MWTLLLVNPASGQGKAAREKRKLLDLVSTMPHIHSEVSTKPNEILCLAKEAVGKGFDRIIAAGGDGTINEVINGIGDADVTLGIIPLGTGNVLAHHLGIPINDIQQALSIINANKVSQVDVAQANGRRFLLMAGMGFDAAVVEDVHPKVKDVLGTMAYAPAVMRQLFRYAPTRFHLAFDEGYVYDVSAYAVILANCGTYAYNFRIAPEAAIDDGMLDILVFGADSESPLRLIGEALGSMFRVPLPGVDAVYLKSSGVKVESDPPAKVQLDGDVCGTTPVNIRVLPKALKLIVP